MADQWAQKIRRLSPEPAAAATVESRSSAPDVLRLLRAHSTVAQLTGGPPSQEPRAYDYEPAAFLSPFHTAPENRRLLPANHARTLQVCVNCGV